MAETERTPRVVSAVEKPPQRVVITGVDIPIGRLIDLLVKLAIASVPAAIIATVLYFFAAMLFYAVVRR